MLQFPVPPPMASNSAPLTCKCLAHRFGNAGDHPHRRPRYPSDMSDAEWAVERDAKSVKGSQRIKVLLPSVRLHAAAAGHRVDPACW